MRLKLLQRTIWHKNALKYFIGYNDNDVIRPLCLRLPKMTVYVNKFKKM